MGEGQDGSGGDHATSSKLCSSQCWTVMTLEWKVKSMTLMTLDDLVKLTANLRLDYRGINGNRTLTM